MNETDVVVSKASDFRPDTSPKARRRPIDWAQTLCLCSPPCLGSAARLHYNDNEIAPRAIATRWVIVYLAARAGLGGEKQECAALQESSLPLAVPVLDAMELSCHTITTNSTSYATA